LAHIVAESWADVAESWADVAESWADVADADAERVMSAAASDGGAVSRGGVVSDADAGSHGDLVGADPSTAAASVQPASSERADRMPDRLYRISAYADKHVQRDGERMSAERSSEWCGHADRRRDHGPFVPSPDGYGGWASHAPPYTDQPVLSQPLLQLQPLQRGGPYARAGVPHAEGWRHLPAPHGAHESAAFVMAWQSRDDSNGKSQSGASTARPMAVPARLDDDDSERRPLLVR
jgi:hypothetical protein